MAVTDDAAAAAAPPGCGCGGAGCVRTTFVGAVAGAFAGGEKVSAAPHTAASSCDAQPRRYRRGGAGVSPYFWAVTHSRWSSASIHMTDVGARATADRIHEEDDARSVAAAASMVSIGPQRTMVNSNTGGGLLPPPLPRSESSG